MYKLVVLNLANIDYTQINVRFNKSVLTSLEFPIIEVLLYSLNLLVGNIYCTFQATSIQIYKTYCLCSPAADVRENNQNKCPTLEITKTTCSY